MGMEKEESKLKGSENTFNKIREENLPNLKKEICKRSLQNTK